VENLAVQESVVRVALAAFEPPYVHLPIDEEHLFTTEYE
jgi:hypothetical protein